MPKVQANGDVGSHSFYPQLSTCQKAGCHVTATSFDVIGGQSAVRASIQELRAELNAKGWLTRSVSAPYDPLSADELSTSPRMASGPGRPTCLPTKPVPSATTS